MSDGNRVALFGGSFDPVHIGHLHIAYHTMETLGLEKVIFVPDRKSPYRLPKVNVADYEHRLAMLNIATRRCPKFAVSDIALEVRGATNTSKVLNRMKDTLREKEVWLILGLDSFLDIPNWKNYKAVIRKVNIAVYQRPGYFFENLDPSLPLDGVRVIAGPQLNISATSVRESLARGNSCRFILPPGVSNYIKKEKLYVS